MGWIIRSFYWNTIDQEMAYEVIEGKIAMDLIKPVSVQGMWMARAMGESAFRLILLTAPTAVDHHADFSVLRAGVGGAFRDFSGAVGSFLLMGAINFLIGTCAIPLKSILSLIRAKYWLIELLSGLLVPDAFFPQAVRRYFRAGCRSNTSPSRRCKLSGQADACGSVARLADQLGLGGDSAVGRAICGGNARCEITIHGG